MGGTHGFTIGFSDGWAAFFLVCVVRLLGILNVVACGAGV